MARETKTAENMTQYEVIPSKVWQHTISGRRVSIYGACPWQSHAEKEQWELVVTGWTVRNPLTGQIGIGQKPWSTEQEAQKWASRHTPSGVCIGD